MELFNILCIVRTNKVSICIERLKQFGYQTLSCYTYTSNIVVALPTGEILPTLESFKIPEDIVDCGTDINYFLTLAAMNDRNDYWQMFVNIKSGKQIICTQLQLSNYITIGELLKTDMLLEIEFRQLPCSQAIYKIEQYLKQYFRKANVDEITKYYLVKDY